MILSDKRHITHISCRSSVYIYSFRLPYCRTNVGKFSLRFQGPELYNSLNPEVQNAPSFAVFTSKLRFSLLI